MYIAALFLLINWKFIWVVGYFVISLLCDGCKKIIDNLDGV